MRRLAIPVAFLLAMLLVNTTYGHAPKNVSLKFHADSRLLSVQVPHAVKDPGKHFVNKLVVQLNGERIIEQKFSSQVSGERQEAVFKIIDARPGDEITVTASCSISGNKKGTLTVPKVEAPEKGAGQVEGEEE